jgi:hypothetical protein
MSSISDKMGVGFMDKTCNKVNVHLYQYRYNTCTIQVHHSLTPRFDIEFKWIS